MPNFKFDPASCLRCPFVYADGRQCWGRIASVKNSWAREGPYELICSSKGSHAMNGDYDMRMIFQLSDLPQEIQDRITKSILYVEGATG